MEAKPKIVGEIVYIEHAWILESPAICRHPLVPHGVLTPFEDFHQVAIQPTSRWWSRKFPEGRPGVVNLIFDNGRHKDKEKCRKKRQRKEPKHLAWD